jgi:hypothetical protein
MTEQDNEAAPVRNAELKAGVLLVLMLALVLGAALYLLYARGALINANAGFAGRRFGGRGGRHGCDLCRLPHWPGAAH